MERKKKELIEIDLASGISMSVLTIWHLSKAQQLGMEVSISSYEHTPEGCLRVDSEVICDGGGDVPDET